jgi:hypothetical protein
MGQVPEATYAGYDQALGSSGQQQQQQGYVPGMGAYSSSSSSYGVGAPYDQQQLGQLPSSQQEQQAQQYDWPPGGYLQQQLPGLYMQQQQPGWYADPSGMPGGAAATPQQQQQQLPGLVDPYLSGAAAAPAGMAAPLDGTAMVGGYGMDGSGMGLPLPPAEDQQQRPAGGGRTGYELVDDWE